MKKGYFVKFKTKSNFLITLIMFFSMVLVLITSGIASSYIVSTTGMYEHLLLDYRYGILSGEGIKANYIDFTNDKVNFCFGDIIEIRDREEIISVTSNSFKKTGLPYLGEGDNIYYKVDLYGVVSEQEDKVFYLHKSLKNIYVDNELTYNNETYTFNGYYGVDAPKYNHFIMDEPRGSATVIIVDSEFPKNNLDYNYDVMLSGYYQNCLSKNNLTGRQIIQRNIKSDIEFIEVMQGIMVASIIVLFISCGSLNYYLLGDLKKDLMKRKLLGMKKKQCFNNLFVLSFGITMISSCASYLLSYIFVYLLTGIGFMSIMTTLFFSISIIFSLIESLIFTSIIYRKSIISLFEKELEEVC